MWVNVSSCYENMGHVWSEDNHGKWYNRNKMSQWIIYMHSNEWWCNGISYCKQMGIFCQYTIEQPTSTTYYISNCSLQLSLGDNNLLYIRRFIWQSMKMLNGVWDVLNDKCHYIIFNAQCTMHAYHVGLRSGSNMSNWTIVVNFGQSNMNSTLINVKYYTMHTIQGMFWYVKWVLCCLMFIAEQISIK